MKKTKILAVTLLVVLVMLVGVGAVACDGNGEETTTPPGNGEATGQSNFTSADGLVEITLDGVERTEVLLHYEEWGDPVPEEDCDFVVVDVTLLRIDGGHVQFQSATILGDDGIEYQESYGVWHGIRINEPAFVTSAEFKPGATGILAFELPKEVQPVRLELVWTFFESWTESWELVGEEEKYIDIILY